MQSLAIILVFFFLVQIASEQPQYMISPNYSGYNFIVNRLNRYILQILILITVRNITVVQLILECKKSNINES